MKYKGVLHGNSTFLEILLSCLTFVLLDKEEYKALKLSCKQSIKNILNYMKKVQQY